jgi:hypothetical protein
MAQEENTVMETGETGETKWGCRPKPRQAEASLTACGTPKSPQGDFSPPVPQGSGGNTNPNKSPENPSNDRAYGKT